MRPVTDVFERKLNKVASIGEKRGLVTLIGPDIEIAGDLTVPEGPLDVATQEPVVSTEAFTIDLAARRVTRDGADVRLTPTEWHLLEVLVRNAGKLVPHRQLLQEVWGPKYESETNYLRVYLAQLRAKLEPDPARPRHLLTEPGMGYRFVV